MDSEYAEEFLEEFCDDPDNFNIVFENPKKKKFSSADKIKLAGLVKEKVAIWNLEEKSHSNTLAVNADWESISDEMNRSVEDCKQAWKSHRDSLRYRVQTKKVLKSGSAAPGPEDETEHQLENNSNWEFAECMAFLASPISGKRRTYSSTTEDNIPQTNGPSTSQASYNYGKKQKTDTEAVTANLLCQSITRLVDLREREQEQAQTQQQHSLKHTAIWACLERMLEMLPEDIIDDLAFQYNQITYTALENYRKEKQ